MKISPEWAAAMAAIIGLLFSFTAVILRWSLNGMRANVLNIHADTTEIKKMLTEHGKSLFNHERRISTIEGTVTTIHSQRKVKV